MADLIDRAALFTDIDQTVVFSGRIGHTAEMRGANKIVDRIKAAKAVDAVEVVRCKDCKHVESVVTPYGERWSCYAWDRYTYPDGYCKEGEFDGERRTECG